MPLILDLDQTLVDSREAEYYRNNRKWQEVYNLIPALSPFEGINEIIHKLMIYEIPFAVVTSSPSSYCRRVLNHWEWKPNAIVCYHDTPRRKPFPDPYEKAIRDLSVEKGSIIAIGDHPNDIIAAKRAKVQSIGVTWGIKNRDRLLEANPDYVLHEVVDLYQFLSDRYSITF
jgi:HAD superfamily hydrolase (TIGR01549 family)